MSKKLSTFDWVEKAKAIHGSRYSYKHVRYDGWKSKVMITCSDHGDFLQSAAMHLAGQGCPDCNPKKQDTTKSFIRKSKLAHGDQYLYDKVKYVRASDKVIITCRIHGDFLQTAGTHTFGRGCFACGSIKVPEMRDAAFAGDADKLNELRAEAGMRPIVKNTKAEVQFNANTKVEVAPIDVPAPVEPAPFKRKQTTTKRFLVASKPGELAKLKCVTPIGRYTRRSDGLSVNIYSGLDYNDFKQHFYIHGESRIAITLDLVSRFWVKAY